MYHHPSRRTLTSETAERLARRLHLIRMARELAGGSVQSLDRHSRFGPLAKAARQNSDPHIPLQPAAVIGFPRQRTVQTEERP